MILLDTNVVAELIRDSPTTAVLDWADSVDSARLALTALTAAELRAGVALLPEGRRKASIETRVDGLLEKTFAGSVLPFDEASAAYYGQVLAARHRSGSPIEPVDAQIAAICLQHRASLATRNTRDFTGLGLQLIDPWAA